MDTNFQDVSGGLPQNRRPFNAPAWGNVNWGQVGGMNVNPSIQPQGVYPAQFTQQLQSLTRALGTPTMHDLRLNRNEQGVSGRSPATQYGLGVDAANLAAQGAMGAGQIGLQHSLANAQNVLAGQIGREQEARQLAGLGLGQWQNNLQNQLALQGGLLGLLGGVGQWWM